MSKKKLEQEVHSKIVELNVLKALHAISFGDLNAPRASFAQFLQHVAELPDVKRSEEITKLVEDLQKLHQDALIVQESLNLLLRSRMR